MSLTMISSNVAGYTKKQLTGAILFTGYCIGKYHCDSKSSQLLTVWQATLSDRKLSRAAKSQAITQPILRTFHDPHQTLRTTDEKAACLLAIQSRLHALSYCISTCLPSTRGAIERQWLRVLSAKKKGRLPSSEECIT